jgi:hypothetical protein
MVLTSQRSAIANVPDGDAGDRNINRPAEESGGGNQ